MHRFVASPLKKIFDHYQNSEIRMLFGDKYFFQGHHWGLGSLNFFSYSLTVTSQTVTVGSLLQFSNYLSAKFSNTFTVII